MEKRYLKQNAYEASSERLQLILCEFEDIYMLFSGGEGSGLPLNPVLDFERKYYPDKQIGVFHQDFETQYTVATQYIEGIFECIKREAKLCWVRLFMVIRTVLGSYEMYWYPWDDTKKE